MQLPEGLELDEYYRVSPNSLERTTSYDGLIMMFRNPHTLIVDIEDYVSCINIYFYYDEIESHNLNVKIEDFNGDEHWISFIAPKLARFIRDNLKEYTVEEYAHIANTIVRSIEEAMRPLLEFEISTSTAKRAL